MNKREINKLLQLPVDERSALADLLRKSVRKDEEIRFVPAETEEVQLARQCLAALVRDGGEGESCEVIEA